MPQTENRTTPVCGLDPVPRLPPLKVCIAAWAPFLSGAEIGAERMALGLQQAGHEVFVVLGSNGEVLDHMRRSGLRCIHVPMHLTDKWRFWRYCRSQFALRRILHRERPQVIHSNDLPTHQMVAAAAQHEHIPRLVYHKFVFDGAAIDWMNKYGAERHLFVSHGVMDDLCRNSTRLRESSRQVVYDGLAMPTLPTFASRQFARREVGLDPDKVVVLFVGQIIERKGIAELLHGWALIPEGAREQAELVLVGGPQPGREKFFAEMQQLAKVLGVEVRFAGFQTNVRTWLMSADVFCLPSHMDPLPLALMEAMAYGLPVVATATTGIPEMVESERSGLLVAPRDARQLAGAINRMLRDEAFRRRCGGASRELCEQRFSLDAQVRQLEREYRAVMQLKSLGGS